MESPAKKKIFSAIQPSGEFTIGNYFGALKNWVGLQDNYECVYCIADLHSITMPQEPEALRKRSFDCLAMLLAAGIDPAKSLVFFQSHVSEHSELAWLLNCFSYMGELSRMTQYKDKSARLAGDTVSVGLFGYPVLMAADILLYDTDIVPVGEDQRQHLELCRDIATRFNQRFGQTFVVPEGLYGESGARIMSLLEPTSKMSKSDPAAGAYVLLADSEDVVINKFKRAVTDSGSEIVHSPQDKPGISNLLEIYSCATGKTIKESEAEFAAAGYGTFKTAVGEAVASVLAPIQERYARLSADKGYLDKLVSECAQKAAKTAANTLARASDKIGLAPKAK
ncbi:MAG: tryptophan--tRNA ligase [Eubacteriaceae bacterium]|nr:tryptophan--tRNA ligase [Eubacteriaceae bacterium]